MVAAVCSETRIVVVVVVVVVVLVQTRAYHYDAYRQTGTILYTPLVIRAAAIIINNNKELK